MSDPGNLDWRKRKALQAILTEPTVRSAADTCGLSEATLRRYMRDERFRSELAQARRQLYADAMGAIRKATTQAVDTLSSVMADVDAPASARVSAARTVLELARDAELENLEERVDALERVSDDDQPSC